MQRRLASLDGGVPDSNFDDITSLDAMLPDTPSSKGNAKPAVSSGGSVFPAAPKAGGDPFPSAPKAGGSNPFPAAPKAGGSNPFPAAPKAGGAPSSVFPAAPQGSRPAPRAAAPAGASPFPAAPGSGAAAAPRNPDTITASAQVNQLFQHYYPGQAPPQETVQYYVRQVTSGAMTIDQVQDQIREALQRYKASQAAAAPAKPAAASPAKPAAAPAKPRFTLEDDGKSMTKDEAQAFVDWLYVKYCGGVNKGDVARKPQLVRDLARGQYSKKMVCWTIQRSKEALKYKEVKDAKRAKLIPYVNKAAKIVCPKNMPTAKEVAVLVEQVLDQEKTLDEVEAELAARA